MPVSLGGNKGGRFDSSTQLYNFAYDNGLQEKADLIVAKHSGQEYKKIFSGGTISDIFDVLSLDSYGVVGLLKGKSFMEGINSRESFSDKDSFGAFGLAGAAAGVLADIAVSPTTYIAPWTALKKIPGFNKVTSGIKEGLLGKDVVRDLGAGKSFTEKVGGIKPVKYLADKLAWMNGQDPVFRETYEKFQRELGISVVRTQKILKPLSRLDAKVGENLLMRDETGRFGRKSLDELQSTLSTEDFAAVKPVWDEMDRLGKELVDLGVLGKDKYEENLGSYIKNAYTEYEEAISKRPFATMSTGIKGTKKRKEGLTEEGMEKLGQIDDPAYLSFKSLMNMNRDVANARLFNKLNDLFATTKEAPGLTRVPDTKRFEPRQGAIMELREKLGKTNDEIAPLLKAMKGAFKDNRQATSAFKSLEKELDKYQKLGIKELEELANASKVPTKPSGISKAPELPEAAPVILKATSKKREKVITTRLKQMSEASRNFRTGFDQGDKTARESIKKLQTEFTTMVRQNFEKSERGQFLTKLKNINTPEKLAKAIDDMIGIMEKSQVKKQADTIEGIMDNLTRLSKEARKVLDKMDAKTGDKNKALSDLVKLEEKISNLKFKKEDIIDEINVNKLGNLSGKYLPAKMMEYINEVIEPTADSLGNKIMAEFKFSKVVLSPATHVRNVLSNMVLNWWKLGISPARLDLYTSSIRDIATDSAMYQRAQRAGLGASSYASQELRGLLDDPSLRGMSKKLGSKWGQTKQILGDLYQSEEDIAKLAAFKYGLSKGLTDEKAWKAAEAATFNYAQVTPFIRQVRTSLFGAPFITFAVKALPSAIETAAKNPQRIAFFQKVRNAFEQQGVPAETEEELAAMPDWMREGFYFRLPMKDQYGRTPYFDMTYLIPFSTLITQGANLSKTVAGEKLIGSETVGQELTSLTPAIATIAEIAKNRDFVGNKIIRETDDFDKQVTDLIFYITKVFAPPPIAAQMRVGYDNNGEPIDAGLRKSIGLDEEDPRQVESVPQELGSYLGMKVRPFDVEIQTSINEYNRKQDLRKLLIENNILREYSNVYEPDKVKQIEQ